MPLSSDLISQFVKVTKDDKKSSQESTLQGTIVYDGRTYVRLDGSDLLTPVSTTTHVEDGERVTVLIKNHSAIVTGNISSPSASQNKVNEVSGEVTQLGIVIADKVSTDELTAELAKIDVLISDKVSTKELEAANAKIENLEAVNVEISGKLTAAEAEIGRLETEKIDATVVEAEFAKIDSLEATDAKIHNLEATYGQFEDLTTGRLEAAEAEIGRLEAEKIDAEEVKAKYATIDFANIDEAAIEKIFGQTGIITNLEIKDGKITGTLDAVRINADWIQSGTLQTDRLLLKGPDGLYYALNVTENGDTTVTDKYTPEELQNGLLGSNIIAKSITAEKISVDDLTAFNAYLAGFHIEELYDAEDNYLTSAIYSGVKQSVHNPTDGIYLDKDGQLAVGNGDEYLKFYQGDDGRFRLAIAASNITLSSGKTVEETVEEAKNIQIGARNLIRNSKTLKFSSYYFMSNPSGINSTSVLGEGTLGDMILGEE